MNTHLITTVLLALSLSPSLLFSGTRMPNFSGIRMPNNGKTPVDAHQDQEFASLANQIKKADEDRSIEDIIPIIDQKVSYPIHMYQVFGDYIVATDEKSKKHIFDKKTVEQKRLITSKGLDITHLLNEVIFIADNTVIVGAISSSKILLAFNAQTGKEIVFKGKEGVLTDIQKIKEGHSPFELSVTLKDGTIVRFDLSGNQIQRDNHYEFALTRDGYLIPVADSSSNPTKLSKA